jgi:hypothetical protein
MEFYPFREKLENELKYSIDQYRPHNPTYYNLASSEAIEIGDYNLARNNAEQCEVRD